MSTVTIRQAQNHMATIFDFQLSCEARLRGLAERCLTAVHRHIAVLENELTEYRTESPVHRLNHSAPGTRIRFSPAGFDLLERALGLSTLTRKNFNPLAKSAQPAEARLGRNPDSREVWRESAGTWLGFGAIGKGFAIDCARTQVEQAGFTDYLLSAGGSSIVLAGQAGAGQDWSWGWSWKRGSAGQAQGLTFRHSTRRSIALGVSGTHEQGAHLIGARAELRSALIATGSAADADALSTALFVSGWEEAREYLAPLPAPPAAAWVDKDETAHWNGGFQKLCALGLLAGLALQTPTAFCQEIDLSLNEGKSSFTPYLFDRNQLWILLPILTFLLLLAHLQKTKPTRTRKRESLTNPMKREKSSSSPGILLLAALTWLSVDRAQGAEIESMNKAVIAILGTPKATKRSVNDGASDVDIFLAKDAAGKTKRLAFIEKGVYPPDCTHTWAIGVDGVSGRILQVRPIEMSCPHAFPTKSASFLDQFKNKGVADVKDLEEGVHVVAKATGTSQLTVQAVKRVLTTFAKKRSTL